MEAAIDSIRGKGVGAACCGPEPPYLGIDVDFRIRALREFGKVEGEAQIAVVMGAGTEALGRLEVDSQTAPSAVG